MTDNATPKPRGGARGPAARYPRSLSLMVTEQMYRAIAEEATDEGEPKATIARRYLELGRNLDDAAESAVRPSPTAGTP